MNDLYSTTHKVIISNEGAQYNGIIDISLPSNTPGNISLKTINGEIFTNFAIDFEKKTKNGLSYIGGGQKIRGTINGGGVDVKLSTINDNIYLRKK